MYRRETKAKIKELSDTVIDLSRYFAIWSELVDSNQKEEREPLIKNYSDFFISTTESHFTSYCITICRLYDERREKDVICINEALDILSEGKTNFKPKIKKLIKSNRREYEKVNILRHKVYAHRDLSISPELIFKAAELTPDQMKSMVESTQKIMGELLETAGVDTYDNFIFESKLREESSQDDVIRLFNSLL